MIACRRNACTTIALRLSLLAFCSSVSAAIAAEEAGPPNIVLILADDLGYSELGCYGQKKIKTPHLDRLAAEGLRFTQHYSGNAVCAPSRCSLMTGKHPGHAYVRNNAVPKLPPELLERIDKQSPGQEPIPDAEVTIGELLKTRGYATAAIGKWGLGHFFTSGDPNRQGFDLFFGYNCQAHAHSYYPGHLWRNGQRVKLDNDPPVPGHARLPSGADPRDPAAYAVFQGKDYAPDRMLRTALGFLRENKDRPFFLYYPSTLPHVALHVPEEDLKPYLGQWDETPFTGNGYTPHRTPRAAYAAMVSRLDKDAGQIVRFVDELGLGRKTLILFSSDNGTTHLDKEVDAAFFQSVGPLRGLKGSLYEGGIRVPLIARWTGTIARGRTSDHLSAFWDLLPTLAELTGATPPPGIDGLSLVPTLVGRGEQKAHPFLYWEFPGYGGQQALRQGRWKAIRRDMLRRAKRDPLAIELYDLQTDVGETRDIAAQHPEIVAKARQIFTREHVPSRLFPMRPID
jgi:arylsulfatase